jgi:hypothetical protein
MPPAPPSLSPIFGVPDRAIQLRRLPLTHAELRELGDFAPDRVNISGPWIEAPDLRFLRDVPSVKAIHVCASKADITTESISSISQLEHVSLDIGQQSPIDLSALPSLKSLTGYWSDSLRLTLEGARIERICILEYRPPALQSLPRVQGLRSLTLPTSGLHKLDIPPWLASLEILDLKGSRKLNAWGSFDLPNLQLLNLDGCRGLQSLEPSFGLKKLDRLYFADAGRKNSLHGIERLERLAVLLFGGSTVIADGDLTPLLRLESLREVRFASRRNYNVKPEDLRTAIESRSKGRAP